MTARSRQRARPRQQPHHDPDRLRNLRERLATADIDVRCQELLVDLQVLMVGSALQRREAYRRMVEEEEARAAPAMHLGDYASAKKSSPGELDELKRRKDEMRRVG